MTNATNLIFIFKQLLISYEIGAFFNDYSNKLYETQSSLNMIDETNIFHIVLGTYYHGQIKQKVYQDIVYPQVMKYIEGRHIPQMMDVLRKNKDIDSDDLISFLSLNSRLISSYHPQKHDFFYFIKDELPNISLDKITSLFFQDIVDREKNYQVVEQDCLIFSFEKEILRTYHATEHDTDLLSHKFRHILSICANHLLEPLKSGQILTYDNKSRITCSFIDPEDKPFLRLFFQSILNNFKEIDDAFSKNPDYSSNPTYSEQVIILNQFAQQALLELKLVHKNNSSIKKKI